MALKLQAQDSLDPRTGVFFRHALQLLAEAGVPFLVGGAYAFARYTGIARHTKDFDVFLREEDVERAMKVFQAAGYETELTFPHWLAKVHCEEDFVDLIFNSGNGLSPVDEEWFANAVEESVLDMPVWLVPPEEMIWQKAFIMERERFDGADVMHVLRASGSRIDWPRLLRRFGSQWRVLYSHLVLFGFVYPGERTTIPPDVMADLAEKLLRESSRNNTRVGKLCRGPLLSRAQYLPDLNEWEYQDARLLPPVDMTEEEIEDWTAAIEGPG